MDIISYEKYINQRKALSKNWMALGNFDGVHKAHREILNDAVKKAKKCKMTPSVLLFEPHPVIYFENKQDFLLTTFEEKVDKMKKSGLKLAIVKPFELEFASKSPYEFAVWIKKLLDVRGISIGYDYTFGAKKRGEAKDLAAYGKGLGFYTSMVPPVRASSGLLISSSRCRDLLKEGRPDEAAEFLGEPYSISGYVVKGDGRGKCLGFPTANLAVPPEKLLPCRGVYLVKVKKDQRFHWGVCNIGRRPTFKKENSTIEIHLLEFNETIYDSSLTLYFIEYVRPEHSFSSPKELTEQLNKDLKYAREKIGDSLQ